MRDIVVLVLSRENNLHIKLTPSLLLDSERGIPDRWSRVSLYAPPHSIQA